MSKPKSAKPPETFKNRYVAQALAETRPSIDSAMLLSDLIDVWGGTRQLAIDIHAEFSGATRGGMTRQRILEMFQRLIITNTTQEIGKVRDASELSGEELQSELMAFVQKVNHVHESAAASDAEGPQE